MSWWSSKVCELLFAFNLIDWFSNLERVASWFKALWRNQNVPSSNPTRNLAGFTGPTSLLGFQWPLKTDKNVLTSGEALRSTMAQSWPSYSKIGEKKFFKKSIKTFTKLSEFRSSSKTFPEEARVSHTALSLHNLHFLNYHSNFFFWKICQIVFILFLSF